MPVAACHASQVDFGRCSPAETQRRKVGIGVSSSNGKIARYAVGAVNKTVTPCVAISFKRIGGAAASSISEVAPAQNGKITSAPSPKVKAIGGEPANISVSFGCNISFANVSAIVKISR